MLTLSNYDASNGDASKIYVDKISDVVVKNVGGVDVTAALISAEILVGNATPTGTDAIVETFGESWSDVARYALEIKTNPDVEL